MDILSEHITRLPDCHYAPGIREANIPDTFKNEWGLECWAKQVLLAAANIYGLWVYFLVLTNKSSSPAIISKYSCSLQSNIMHLLVFTKKFRSETLKIPICWFGCAGNNVETECLGCEELCQSGIIQRTENVLKHNQLQKAKKKNTLDCTIAGTRTERLFFVFFNNLGFIFIVSVM